MGQELTKKEPRHQQHIARESMQIQRQLLKTTAMRYIIAYIV